MTVLASPEIDISHVPFGNTGSRGKGSFANVVREGMLMISRRRFSWPRSATSSFLCLAAANVYQPAVAQEATLATEGTLSRTVITSQMFECLTTGGSTTRT
jgi:hypothetical protein